MRARFEGIVREANGDRAVVRLLKGAERCIVEELGAAGPCEVDDLREPFGGKPKLFQVEALNPIGAKRGQRVRLEFQSASVVGGSMALYLVPALLFFVGLILGGTLAPRWGLTGDAVIGMQLVGGFVLMALAAVAAKLYSRWWAPKPRVVEIVKPSPEKLARFRAEMGHRRRTQPAAERETLLNTAR